MVIRNIFAQQPLQLGLAIALRFIVSRLCGALCKQDRIVSVHENKADQQSVHAAGTRTGTIPSAALQKSKECVISIPTVDLLDKIVGVGTCSSADTDKFEKIRLTPVEGKHVRSPLVKECLANIQCNVIDFVEKYNIVALEGVAAYFDNSRKV